jgi:putative transposase
VTAMAPATWRQAWVVPCQPVGTGQAALKYLAPYVFRVALSNNCILKLQGAKSPSTTGSAPAATGKPVPSPPQHGNYSMQPSRQSQPTWLNSSTTARQTRTRPSSLVPPVAVPCAGPRPFLLNIAAPLSGSDPAQLNTACPSGCQPVAHGQRTRLAYRPKKLLLLLPVAFPLAQTR